MKRKLIALTAVVAIFIAIESCEYHDLPTQPVEMNSDSSLFVEIQQPGFFYFQNGDLLPGVSPSSHGAFKLRFNKTAWDALDASGKLPVNKKFPTGSIIVKEAFIGNDLAFYAVIKKAPADPNAGSGWLWAEYYANGITYLGISHKGTSCVSCHSQATNRDLTRTFDLH